MLRITIPATEFYDELTNEFIAPKEQTLQLEHSLISISKWESKWKKPFLSKEPRTPEEDLDYVRCMTITPNADPLVYNAITPDIYAKIKEYMEDKMTATRIKETGGPKGNQDMVTAEILYFKMIDLHIPFECEKWHLNKLLTLIRVCEDKTGPQKKMSKREVMASYREANAIRRQRLHSKG
jgi:hypothetical protein